jgi:hypothetical protein
LAIYLIATVAIVPIIINIVLNILIFRHVRSSARRVQPAQSVITATTGNINQQQRISGREIALLRQMIFMFTIFIVGWSPNFFFLVIRQVMHVNTILYNSMVSLCEASVLSLLINLFICNHELRKYLFNKIRVCFVRQ